MRKTQYENMVKKSAGNAQLQTVKELTGKHFTGDLKKEVETNAFNKVKNEVGSQGFTDADAIIKNVMGIVDEATQTGKEGK